MTFKFVKFGELNIGDHFWRSDRECVKLNVQPDIGITYTAKFLIGGRGFYFNDDAIVEIRMADYKRPPYNEQQYSNALRKIEQGRVGMSAEMWFGKMNELRRTHPNQYTEAVLVDVHWDSGSFQGESAQTYIRLAFKEILPDLLQKALDLAKADIAVGQELLK